MGSRDVLETAAYEAGGTDRLAAFEALTDRCLDDAYRLATVVLRDAVEAEDVVHDAAIQAFRRFGSLRERERFDAWFGRIVLNLCRDRLRSRQREARRDLVLSGEMGHRQPDGFDTLARREAVGAAFSRLSPDLQIVVALRFWRDLKLEAIAEYLEIPLGTVKSRLNTAEKQMRAELERNGWTEEGSR